MVKLFSLFSWVLLDFRYVQSLAANVPAVISSVAMLPSATPLAVMAASSEAWPVRAAPLFTLTVRLWACAAHVVARSRAASAVRRKCPHSGHEKGPRRKPAEACRGEPTRTVDHLHPMQVR